MSEVSEAELRQWREGAEAGGESHFSCPRLTSWRPQERYKKPCFHLSLSFVFSFVASLVRTTSSCDRPGRRAEGSCNVSPPRTGIGL